MARRRVTGRPIPAQHDMVRLESLHAEPRGERDVWRPR